MFDKMKTFFQDSRFEFKRVNWPRREETIKYTIFVIGFSLGLAAFLGFLDYIFVQILERII